MGLRIALALSLPCLAFADGIDVEHYTLSAVPFVLLVKVLALDAKRHMAKVSVLKKWVKPETSNSGANLRASVYKSENWKEQRADLKSTDRVAFAEIKESAEYTTLLMMPTESRSGKWVIENRYWDEAQDPQQGHQYFLLSRTGGFVFTKASDQKKEIVQILFEKNADELKKFLENKNDNEIQGFLQNQDLQDLALNEVIRRKSISAEFLLALEPSQIYAVGRQYLAKLGPEEAIKFHRSVFQSIIKKSPAPERIVQYLNLYTAYSALALPFAEEILFFGKLDINNPDLYKKAQTFFYKVDRQIKEQKIVHLENLGELILASLQISKPLMHLDLFFGALPPEEKKQQMRNFSKALAQMGMKSNQARFFESLPNHLLQTPDLETAKNLLALDLQDLDRASRKKYLEPILKTVFQSDDLKNSANRENLVRFIKQQVDLTDRGLLPEDLMKQCQDFTSGK